MTEINRLNRAASLEGGDLIPIWDSSDGATRSVSANVAGEFFTGAAAQIIQPLVDEATQAAESAAESAESAAGSVFGVREVQRRSYAEAGYTLADGSFELGGVVSTADGVLLYEAEGKAYSWGGVLPKTVAEGSTPTSAGGIGAGKWEDVASITLRSELAASAGAGMIGTVGGRTQADRNSDTYTVKDAGAKGDGVTNDSAAFNALGNKPWLLPSGEYFINPNATTAIDLHGIPFAKIKQVNTAGNLLSFRPTSDGGCVSDLSITSNKPSGAVGHQMDIRDGNNFTVKDVTFKEDAASGFSLICYPSNQAYQERVIINNIRGEHGAYIPWENNGLVLQASNRFSIANNLIAKHYAQFGAFEYKTDSKHNIASNIIADSCQNGIYLGTESPIFPSFNIMSNIIGYNAAYAVLNTETSHHNLFSNIIADYTDSADVTQPHGVTMAGDANVVDNLYIAGMLASQAAYPMRVTGSARNNYFSTFAHYTANPLVNFESTTTRNYVEVKHPGEKNDIFAIAGILGDRSTFTGNSSSNVVHVPALGQYFGTMSGRFEWRVKDLPIPASTVNSNDVFRFISSGTVSMAIGGGTTAAIKFFLDDGTIRNITMTGSGSLKLDVGSGNSLIFESAALTPSSTNIYALGSASKAWSGGFTQTAFTVTSDERVKSTPLEITDAMLDAAAEVDWVQYQYLDRVEAKGKDGARWHFGAIAQRFIEAFARHGLDAHDYGFLCYDEWDDEYEPVMATRLKEKEREEEEDAWEEYDTGEMKLVLAAGNRYGIRYEEALALEAALQRRNYQRLLARVESLEVKNAT